MTYTSLLINKLDIVHTTLDKYGQVTATVVEPAVTCRIEYQNRLMRNFKGEEVLSYARVFFLTSASLSLLQDDKLRFDGQDWSIIRLERQQDSFHIHHLEVYVG
jgi:hypothetical protein